MSNNNNIFLALFFLINTLHSQFVLSHAEHHASKPYGPDGMVVTDWPGEQLSKLVSAGYGESLGSDIYSRQGFPVVEHKADSICATGSYLAFDVNDDFAFDIDESVSLSFRVLTNGANNYQLGYDKNAQAENFQLLSVEQSGGWNTVRLTLDRARFANRGQADTDFFFSSPTAESSNLVLDKTHQLTVCDVKLTRDSAAVKKNSSQTKGTLSITTLDQNKPVSVRLGLYDQTGRMPLPSAQALSFQHYGRQVKQYFLRDTWDSHEPWPSKNRNFFYSAGSYQADIPAGKYQLIISKGPEYHTVEKTINIKPDQRIDLSVNLQRFANMPKQGWYAGDGHIHLERLSAEDNKNVLSILSAEDIHVSNLLRMGNFATTHYPQYAFGEAGQYQQGNHSLASGVEDPRTGHRGHTIGLNVSKPMHDRGNYYLYHNVFSAHQQQGGLTGYAHVGTDWFNDKRGLALDVPFGLVDFVEVMQNGQIQTGLWYDFLNLGYKLQPMAGSDYPYIDQPGSVRAYAKVQGQFTPAAWFNAVEKGRVFVSNGPLLKMKVNGEDMGQTLSLAQGGELKVTAQVSLNPDLDQLDRIELVSQGEVIKQLKASPGDTHLEISHRLKPEQGLWLAVRAYGKGHALAHSAPVYVNVGDSDHRSAAKAPTIIAGLIEQLTAMKQTPDPVGELEYWEIKPGFEELWQQQKTELYQRIDEAIEHYRAL